MDEQLFDLSRQVTLQLNGNDSQHVAAKLAQLIGTQVVFNPRRPDATFTLNAENVPLWDVLNSLSSDASIQVGYEDFGHLRAVRQALLSSERMSVCFSNVSAGRLADDLSFLTGRDVYVHPGRARVVVKYSGKGVTFEEILAQLSESSGVQFAIR